MRRINWIILCCISIFTFAVSAPAWAKTMYVNDMIKITMRKAPGMTRKIIAMPQSGNAVQVLETESGWSRIRLPDGKEGWVLSRFLTSKKPNELQLRNLQKEYKEIKERIDTLDQENTKLKSENEILKNDTAEKQSALDSLSQSYETLKNESKDYLTVKAAFEKAAAALSKQKEKADSLEAVLSTMEWKRNVIWFLCGGGVFLLGFLIGSVNHRNKTQRARKYY